MLIVIGTLGIVAGRAGFFSDPERLALWQEIQHSGEGTEGVWLLDPHDVPPAVKLATFRPGAESFKMTFPIPPPPMAGTIQGGLRVKRDGGTVYYVFEGLRLPAGTTDAVRAWAEEWPCKGWDAGLVVAGVAFFGFGWLVQRGT